MLPPVIVTIAVTVQLRFLSSLLQGREVVFHGMDISYSDSNSSSIAIYIQYFLSFAIIMIYYV